MYIYILYTIYLYIICLIHIHTQCKEVINSLQYLFSYSHCIFNIRSLTCWFLFHMAFSSQISINFKNHILILKSSISSYWKLEICIHHSEKIYPGKIIKNKIKQDAQLHILWSSAGQITWGLVKVSNLGLLCLKPPRRLAFEIIIYTV